MRPKKVILCVNTNEHELSITKFMLATNGYKVLSATNNEDAIATYGDSQIDLVLIDGSSPNLDGNLLVKKLKLLSVHVPMLMLGDPQKMDGQIHAADATVAKKACSTHDLLERIKVMSARKRGPRKGMQRLASNAELAVAS